MEEQRRVQEAEIDGNQQNPSTDPGTSSTETDVTRLTEDEQIALAIQMSMSQADNSSSFAFPFFFN